MPSTSSVDVGIAGPTLPMAMMPAAGIATPESMQLGRSRVAVRTGETRAEIEKKRGNAKTEIVAMMEIKKMRGVEEIIKL